jgi:hypothetical protein
LRGHPRERGSSIAACRERESVRRRTLGSTYRHRGS